MKDDRIAYWACLVNSSVWASAADEWWSVALAIMWLGLALWFRPKEPA